MTERPTWEVFEDLAVYGILRSEYTTQTSRTSLS
jgi:hypothetical protein